VKREGVWRRPGLASEGGKMGEALSRQGIESSLDQEALFAAAVFVVFLPVKGVWARDYKAGTSQEIQQALPRLASGDRLLIAPGEDTRGCWVWSGAAGCPLCPRMPGCGERGRPITGAGSPRGIERTSASPVTHGGDRAAKGPGSCEVPGATPNAGLHSLEHGHELDL